MGELVDAVRAALPQGCETEACRAQGCELTLTGISADRVIVDMDRLDLSWLGDVERCDRLFVGYEEFVAAIELKSGDIRASQVLAQLKTGSAVAHRYVPDIAEVQFRPVAAYSGRFHRIDRDRLRRKNNRVPFRGESFGLRVVRCKSPLLAALRKIDR